METEEGEEEEGEEGEEEEVETEEGEEEEGEEEEEEEEVVKSREKEEVFMTAIKLHSVSFLSLARVTEFFTHENKHTQT